MYSTPKSRSALDRKTASRMFDTLAIRREFLVPLGLDADDEEALEYYELRTKKSAGEFNLAELRAIENFHITSLLQSESLPERVASKANGAMLLRDGRGDIFVFRKSTPQRSEIVKATLTPVDGSLSFTVGPQEIVARVEDCRFTRHTEASILDIMFFNGELHYLTLHNLVPKGVHAPMTADGNLVDPTKGEWIHQPGRWGAGTKPITTSFVEIVRHTDPTWLDTYKLYPLGCKHSPVRYRFAISTRDRVRADTQPINTFGFITYLGHSVEWTKEDWVASGRSVEELGTWHSDDLIYRPQYPSEPANEDKAYIVSPPANGLSLAEANAILEGNYDELANRGFSETDALRLCGGGKLIATVTYEDLGGMTRTGTFHIASPSHVYRSGVMGNDENLYAHFTRSMNLRPYPDTTIGYDNFKELYCVLKSPETEAAVKELAGVIRHNAEFFAGIEGVEHADEYLHHLITGPGVDHCIWLNFLVSANVSIREKVFRYFIRYVQELNTVTDWLLKGFRLSDYTGGGHKLTEDGLKRKEDAILIDEFIKTVNRRATNNKVALREFIFYGLRSGGQNSARVLKKSIDLMGTKRTMIKISDTDATFHDKNTYATKTATVPPSRSTKSTKPTRPTKVGGRR